VFADYPLDAPPEAVSVLPGAEVLTFSLGGLSKSAGLPQVKLGWIGVGGPPAEVDRALAAYEIIADTYLSVSTPVQAAAPELIGQGAAIRSQILARVRRNLDSMQTLTAAYPALSVLRVEGGWSAVLQVPQLKTEEALVLELLERDDVLVHPGYFFDFPREAYLVVSLLVDPDRFDRAIGRVLVRATSS
jgi:alanine-synthesizing transaminase